MNQPPATADGLNDTEDISAKPAGLERKFSVGEQIPLKGIWFRVEHVSMDRILLQPMAETARHHKLRTRV